MRVTVVIPCYNNVDTIGSTIESVNSQDYDNREIAVVDCGSTDGSCDVVKKIGDNCFIHGFLIDQQVSEAFAKNLAIRQMWDKTDLFIFLKPTDEILPNGIGRFVAAVDDPSKIGLLYADELYHKTRIYKSALIPESAAIGGNFAVTKKGFEVAGLFNNSDLDLVGRILLNLVSIHIAEPLFRTTASRS